MIFLRNEMLHKQTYKHKQAGFNMTLNGKHLTKLGRKYVLVYFPRRLYVAGNTLSLCAALNNRQESRTVARRPRAAAIMNGNYG